MNRYGRIVIQGLLALLVAAAFGQSAQAERIVLATWNLSWLNDQPDTGLTPRSEADYQVLRKYAQRLDADVVAVEEVENTDALRRVFGDGYRYHLSGAGGAQKTGFAIRNGVPFTPLPDYQDLNYSGHLRPGAQIRLDLESGPIRLMAVHLKSGCFSAAEDESNNSGDLKACRGLYRQVPELEDWINRAALRGTPYIVLGDFNRRLTAPGDWVMAELDFEPGDPAAADVQSVMAGSTPHCWPQFHAYIDHILVSPGVASQVVPGSFQELVYDAAGRREAGRVQYPSDHCPDRVTLNW